MRQVTFVCIDRSKAPKVSERQSTILSKFAWKEARNKQTSNLGDYELGLLSKTRTNSGRTLQTLLHQTRTWPCSMSVPLPRLLITKVSNGSSHHKGAAKLSHHLRFVPGAASCFRPHDSRGQRSSPHLQLFESHATTTVFHTIYSCVKILLVLFYRVSKPMRFSKRR